MKSLKHFSVNTLWTIIVSLYLLNPGQSIAQDLSVTSSGSWRTVEDAYIDNKGRLVLTQESNYDKGAVWFKKGLDLSQDFEIIFDVYLGSRNGSGCEGIAFVLHRDDRGYQSIGEYYGGIGYGDDPSRSGSLKTNPSLAIEFDTHESDRQIDDEDFDHVGISKNGYLRSMELGPIEFGKKIKKKKSGPYTTYDNVEDSDWHDVKIT